MTLSKDEIFPAMGVGNVGRDRLTLHYPRE